MATNKKQKQMNRHVPAMHSRRAPPLVPKRIDPKPKPERPHYYVLYRGCVIDTSGHYTLEGAHVVMLMDLDRRGAGEHDYEIAEVVGRARLKRLPKFREHGRLDLRSLGSDEEEEESEE